MTGELSDGYGEMVASLRTFLDNVAAARPDDEAISDLTADLKLWSKRLAGVSVPERHQVFGRRRDLPGRGQSMSPLFTVSDRGRDWVRGRVTFGRYFLGGNGAAHGGAIPLLFDEVLGVLSSSGGRAPSRTAYLHVDYRAVTPVDRELSLEARLVSEEGRKRILSVELRDGPTLCAEGQGLFIALRRGQQ